MKSNINKWQLFHWRKSFSPVTSPRKIIRFPQCGRIMTRAKSCDFLWRVLTGRSADNWQMKCDRIQNNLIIWNFCTVCHRRRGKPNRRPSASTVYHTWMTCGISSFIIWFNLFRSFSYLERGSYWVGLGWRVKHRRWTIKSVDRPVDAEIEFRRSSLCGDLGMSPGAYLYMTAVGTTPISRDSCCRRILSCHFENFVSIIHKNDRHR